MDEHGQVFAEVKGLQAQRLEAPAPPLPEERWLYGLDWKGREPSPSDAWTSDGGWLVLGDAAGVGAKLAEKLRAAGRSVVLVKPERGFSRIARDVFACDPGVPDVFKRLLREAFGDRPCAGIVHLWPLDSRVDATSAAPRRRIRRANDQRPASGAGGRSARLA